VITSPAFRGKRYAVLGLARSGLATVRSLVASGAEVVAWDAREEGREAVSLSPSGERLGEGTVNLLQTDSPLSQPSPLKGRGLSLADPLTIDLSGFDGIVVSPGVPINRHPIADAARAANVPIIGDIELFAQARASLPPHKVVGITGTNGKSTTTALIHHILKSAGVPTLMGGNIGLPILSQDPLPEGGVYVLELSSFQIDLTFTLDCDVAVLLNITPDHLDRYESFEAYAEAKGRLLEMQSFDNGIVFGSTFDGIPGKTSDQYFGQQKKVWCQPHWTMQDPADLWDAFDSSNWRSVQSDWPALQGPHNAENAGAAICACRMLGLTDDELDVGLRMYPGLPHRMERVREVDGVLYVNDSKATNATSTAPALAAYPAIHWIAGGQAKTKELDACAPYFGHVKAAYTIGEAGPMFAELLSPHMATQNSVTLEAAVTAARSAAKAGEVVLLSPACASFDQFKDFEHRGDTFRALVEAMA
jgi:UDP-N-acetylmuramoylalanine--D-glutamate ligase